MYIQKLVNAAVAGYVKALLWTTLDDEGEPLDQNYSIDDLTPEGLMEITECVEDFVFVNLAVVEKYDPWGIGHDFLLTRNRHGAGFWDGGYAELDGSVLTAAAHAYGETTVFEAIDGRLEVD